MSRCSNKKILSKNYSLQLKDKKEREDRLWLGLSLRDRRRKNKIRNHNLKLTFKEESIYYRIEND
jgi:hypothetical protein